MGQSVSFYSINEKSFKELEKNEDADADISHLIKNVCTLDGSFMGLESTLLKDQTEEAIYIIEQIFNPPESIGGTDFSEINIDTIDPEALEALVMADASIYYLPPETVASAANVLERISEDELAGQYDPEELNNNDIYPGTWHLDNSPDKAFNLPHLLQDFEAMKTFFRQAALEKDYVLCYTG